MNNFVCLAAGHIWKKCDGALWHGTTDINDFSNANRSNYNKVSIRAGDPNDGTSPTNDNSGFDYNPAGNRGSESFWWYCMATFRSYQW